MNINNLFILYETYTDGYRADILDIISLSAILCGIFVIISKNPVVSVLFLIGLFASISCYLIMLGLSFIGLSYWASVRLLLKLYKSYRGSIPGSSIWEERLAYPVEGNNSTVGNNRETIACQVKWVDADISGRCKSVQENTPAQGPNMADTEL